MKGPERPIQLTFADINEDFHFDRRQVIKENTPTSVTKEDTPISLRGIILQEPYDNYPHLIIESSNPQKPRLVIGFTFLTHRKMREVAKKLPRRETVEISLSRDCYGEDSPLIQELAERTSLIKIVK